MERWTRKKGETRCETDLGWEGDGRVSKTALRVLSESAQMSFSNRVQSWNLRRLWRLKEIYKEDSKSVSKINLVSGAKNESRTRLLYLLKRGSMLPKLRRFEAWRDLAETTPRTQNVLAKEAPTCEAWFQLTFRPQKRNLKSARVASDTQHEPSN